MHVHACTQFQVNPITELMNFRFIFGFLVMQSILEEIAFENPCAVTCCNSNNTGDPPQSAKSILKMSGGGLNRLLSKNL